MIARVVFDDVPIVNLPLGFFTELIVGFVTPNSFEFAVLWLKPGFHGVNRSV